MSTTFIMLKPDAMAKDLENEILDIFRKEGIDVLRSKSVKIDEALILKHYEEVIQRVAIPGFADRLKREFVGQTVRVFELHSNHEHIFEKVRQLIGPTEPIKAGPDTIRGRFSSDSYDQAKLEDRPVRNLIHASDSEESAAREIELWFNHN
jgi:nucleoside-diphosphate kinase